ncbi:MAG TPA: F0F1 ATP synthase subunit alpha, partial [Chloroflexia bacterium]
IIYAVTNGYMDDVPVEQIRSWEEQFHSFMGTAHPEVLETITTEKRLSDETTAALVRSIEEFKRTVSL